MISSYRYLYGLRMLIAIALLFGSALIPARTWAGHMFLEYRGELEGGYTFFRGAFDLGDLDRDGCDEMVIADDEGGYHVYHFTPAGFVPMWISNPIVESGHIVAVEILHENVHGIMPQILLLDSHGTLHQIHFTGYLFEETAAYEDFRPPGESGRLMVTDIGGGRRTLIIALANARSQEGGDGGEGGVGGEVSEDSESREEDEEDENIEEEGEGRQEGEWILYRLTPDGLAKLTEEELGALEEGEVYFVQELTETDVSDLLALGSERRSIYAGSTPGGGLAGLADLDRDALLELLLALSDPERPIDRLEIYSEEEGKYTIRITLELPLINEMVLGDVDGDGFTEIVGLTYDGEVLVYQWDPLTVLLADGTEITWETSHKEIEGIIWMSLGGFEALGCEALGEADSLEVRRNDLAVVLDRAEGKVRCGDEIVIPEVPAEILESVPFLPFFSTLECLGFHYSYNAEKNVVEVEAGG